MKNSRRLSGALAALALVALNCDDWHSLDDVFTRSSLVNARGWTGGDGAVGVRLPGGNDRTLWVFGDSAVTGIDTNLQRVYRGNPLFDSVWGNTIAIQESSNNPSPNQIAFWARKADPTCSNLPSSPLPACPIKDVTRLDNPNVELSQFFDYRMIGLDPPAVDGANLWPSGGICVNCDGAPEAGKIVLSFAEIRFCDVVASDPDCRPLCGFSGGTTDDCSKGVKTVSNVIARIENPSLPISNWIVHSMRIAGPTPWASFMQFDASTLYIYGTRPNVSTNPPPDLTKAQRFQLVVAKVGIDDVLDQRKWRYLKAGQFVPIAPDPHQTTPPFPTPSTLDKVANGAGWMSVVKVNRANKQAYVLLHDNPFVDHFIYARTSTSPTSFPEVTITTPRTEIAAFDKPLRDEILTRPFALACPFPTTPNTYRTCGLNYHAVPHPHLSFRDGNNELAYLVFSYIIPQPQFPNTTPKIDTYRPDFSFIPLDNLAPWCSGASCWSGIVFQWNTTGIAAGAVSGSTAYDVSKASRFYASLMSGTGDPDLYVKFGSQPTTTSYDCRGYRSTFPDTCDIAVPPGQTTAYVMVHGFSAGSYTMRVNYNGD